MNIWPARPWRTGTPNEPRLTWFSLGVAAAPLAWGVAHVTYIAVDDWLTARRMRRRDLENRLDGLAEDAGEIAHALADPGKPETLTPDIARRLGHQLEESVWRALEDTR